MSTLTLIDHIFSSYLINCKSRYSRLEDYACEILISKLKSYLCTSTVTECFVIIDSLIDFWMIDIR